MDEQSRIETTTRGWFRYKTTLYTGVVTGFLLAMVLGRGAGLPGLSTALLMAAAVATSYATAIGTKLLLGRETYSLYHYKFVVLGSVGVLSWTVGRFDLRLLDVVSVGLALTQACGRMGCFRAGCCHGRPHRWGVAYGLRSLPEGFPPWLAGVKLLPLQMIEAVGFLCLATLGALSVSAGAPAGWALSGYLVGYGLLRFLLEFWRADMRRFWGGFSEAQWTSLALVAATATAEWSGMLPWRPAHALSALALLLLMPIIALLRQRGVIAAPSVWFAQHLGEISAAIDRVNRPVASRQSGGDPLIQSLELAETSQGLLISSGPLPGISGKYHYSVSRSDGAMTTALANSMGKLIRRLRFPEARTQVVAGSHGVFHLIFDFGLEAPEPPPGEPLSTGRAR